ncbi:outer membrane lipoprotein chaperone LolA [Modicisalibacter tunisiensis]|uniref:outer membrane lipoprotein chaperone LolA n=1 Tax=Modicisalibacter tunisiensis TaxID=390637 RepID=UPI001CCB776C|nr:outer membrane lipoprotein chaperone LolA [Modicisalibacter tunisiensis]MBZ9538604.1 outer membrane lipoprotein chaperone LolA [Modicisalibacter tunisiensis]
MKGFKTLMATGLLLLLAPLAASADSQAADRLAALLEPLDSYAADFDQKILDSSGNRLQEAKGRMWLSRPGKFRWEVEDPYRQVVVSDGDKVYLYDPDLEQVTVQPLDTRVTHTPALLLSGSSDALTKNYRVSRQQQGTAETFTLIPQTPDTLFESLKMIFYSERLGGLKMTDSTGQRTAIEFRDATMNQAIDDSRFVFEIPEGTDVIRDTQ